jgi:hypothetical protein
MNYNKHTVGLLKQLCACVRACVCVSDATGMENATHCRQLDRRKHGDQGQLPDDRNAYGGATVLRRDTNRKSDARKQKK